MTPEIRRVFASISPDQVAEGFYTFDGSTLTMMGDDGKGNWTPIALDEEPVTATCTADLAEAVARRLTKRIRKVFRGELVEGFSRALKYENEAFA